MALRTILDLPDELLLQLPRHMHNIEDFMNALSTCKRLRNVFADTLPKTILHLAVQSAPTFFSPHPYFLALSVARQVSAWAVAVESERKTRKERLVEALRVGVRGIVDLALSEDAYGVGLTMQDVRRMHDLRFRVINPLNDTVDAMIGNAWYAQPNFWSGGADDAFTLYADVNSATMQLLLYGELFGETMESYLRPAAKLPTLGADVRVEFVKYCVPDWICAPNGHGRHDGFRVLPVGPYGKEKNDEDRLQGNQTALAHLIGGAMFEGTLWKRAWRRVLVAAGALENDDDRWPEEWEYSSQDGDAQGLEHLSGDWRFKLFWVALAEVGGLDTFEMVAQFKGREAGKEVVMKPEWKAKILQIRDQVLALEDCDKPGVEKFGKRRKLKISNAPDPGSEFYWCCCGMWGGL
ncbi:hypothetical protein K491DRAFT_709101 [Lophiostoma macrostomum CBS 122681]|uniref:F-box domain-containing protein n=1 Tax=Lophiostoma macrostomum CBS 122681 TaxID=1314788 RepID=A0A6A6SL35_9PLEO|nr:hypothetical protein K491DRAFT_709101 [Lophiostoma macrostomum CBS 122681]